MTSQNCDESQTPYSYFGTTLNKSLPRVSYLRSIFGITDEYCHTFRFDGNDFWIPNQISYKKVNHLQCDSSEFYSVDKNKYNLPDEICKTVYDYSCLDGSPDMRYSNNHGHTYTFRFLISFHCDDFNYRIYTFAPSQHIVNYALDKFNIMLSVKDKIDIESHFESYLSIFRRKEDLEKTKDEFDERRKVLESIVRSLSALPVDMTNSKTEPSMNKDHVISELASINDKFKKLIIDIEQAKHKMFEMTQKLRKVIELHMALVQYNIKEKKV